MPPPNFHELPPTYCSLVDFIDVLDSTDYDFSTVETLTMACSCDGRGKERVYFTVTESNICFLTKITMTGYTGGYENEEGGNIKFIAGRKILAKKKITDTKVSSCYYVPPTEGKSSAALLYFSPINHF